MTIMQVLLMNSLSRKNYAVRVHALFLLTFAETVVRCFSEWPLPKHYDIVGVNDIQKKSCYQSLLLLFSRRCAMLFFLNSHLPYI